LLFATTVTRVVRCVENKQQSGISAVSLQCWNLLCYFRQAEVLVEAAGIRSDITVLFLFML